MANQIKKKESAEIVDINLLLEDSEAGHNMSNDDMMIPRLRILQDGSPQVKKRDGAYVDGAEPGHIFDNVSRQVYDGEKGIMVVPVTYRGTYIEWKPDRGGLVGDRGPNYDTSECKANEKGKLFLPNGNEVVRTNEYFVFVVDDDGVYSPALISMSSSGLKKSKRWNSMINRLQIPHPNGSGTINPAMFWTAYRLTSVPESNDDGSWMNWEVEMVFDAKSGGILANLPTGKDIYLEARNFRNKVKDGDIKVSADDSQDANDDF